MDSNNSLAIINASSPYSLSNGKDALDLALIFGSYEQDIALFFIGDGIWQLVNGANGELLGIKDYLKTFSALPFYDVENIYVCRQSLEERQLTLPLNIDQAVILSPKEFSLKIRQYKSVLRF